MLVRVVARKVPNVGFRGDVRNIDAPSARVLILLGKVEKVEAEPVAPTVVEAKPAAKKTVKKRTYKKPVVEQPKKKVATKKRTYKRRDMKAEK